MSNNSQSATLDDVVDKLEDVKNSLEEISVWLKITGTEKVEKLLNSNLNSPEKILVYHYSDGKTTREINSLSNASLGSISKYQTSWHRLGLMKKITVKGKERYVKNFNLEDHAIKIPENSQKQGSTQQITEKVESIGN